MKLKINITEDDIAEGEARNPVNCAVCRAMNREIDKAGWGISWRIKFVPYSTGTDCGMWLENYRDSMVPRVPIPWDDVGACLLEFAMNFDAWREFVDVFDENKEAWAEYTGEDPDDHPDKCLVSPFEFTIDIPINFGKNGTSD